MPSFGGFAGVIRAALAEGLPGSAVGGGAARVWPQKSAEIAKKAHIEGTTLKQAALTLGYVSAEDFDKWVDPSLMVSGG